MMGKKGEKQFRWSKPMEYLMLEILADEVKQGNKSTNHFKTISFNRVSNAIKQQLGMDCSPKHVEHHLKTLRNSWDTVQTLLNKSGLGWDDTLKMITASPSVYATYIQGHPKHDKFTNKKIDMFEEMSIVCGNDRARGDCAKSLDDIGLDCSLEKNNVNDIEGPSMEKDVQDVASETSQLKSSCKRNRSSYVKDSVGDISTKLGEVAAAISKIADSCLDVTKLYEEIMAIEVMRKSSWVMLLIIWCKMTL